MPLSFNPFDMVDVFQGAIAAIGLVAAIVIALGLISLWRAKGGRAGRGGAANWLRQPMSINSTEAFWAAFLENSEPAVPGF